MNLILLGPPGAGKGTHAQNLVENFNYYHFSTGDLLREEVKKKTKLGEKIFSSISKGDFVSDESGASTELGYIFTFLLGQ